MKLEKYSGNPGVTLPNTPEGERNQAIVVRNYYRLWFSHPSVNAITWWNLVEGTAVKGEDKWNAGLVRRDFTPKPAFIALDQLINHDWKTKFETNIVTNILYIGLTTLVTPFPAQS